MALDQLTTIKQTDTYFSIRVTPDTSIIQSKTHIKHENNKPSYAGIIGSSMIASID